MFLRYAMTFLNHQIVFPSDFFDRMQCLTSLCVVQKASLKLLIL